MFFCFESCAVTAARAGLAAVNASFVVAGKTYLKVFCVFCFRSCAVTAARAGLAAVNDSFALAGTYLIFFVLFVLDPVL